LVKKKCPVYFWRLVHAGFYTGLVFDMKEIVTKKGFVIMVSDLDFDWLSKLRWRAVSGNGKPYAQTRFTDPKTKKRTTVMMHRLILGVVSQHIQVDHKDGNGLNNQRGNLRIATRSENQHNRAKNKNNPSGFKGVCWNKASRKWCANIRFNGKARRIGQFDSVVDAAKAYDEKAKEYFGEFARTNF
jgi:hypothetical protein